MQIARNENKPSPKTHISAGGVLLATVNGELGKLSVYYLSWNLRSAQLNPASLGDSRGWRWNAVRRCSRTAQQRRRRRLQVAGRLPECPELRSGAEATACAAAAARRADLASAAPAAAPAPAAPALPRRSTRRAHAPVPMDRANRTNPREEDKALVLSSRARWKPPQPSK